jgi:hypothetical protein
MEPSRNARVYTTSSKGEGMKVKWWRWWIVPLILTITFEVGVARLLVIGLGNLWGEMSAGYSFTRLLLSGLFVFIPPDAAIVMWPLFLGLVWPAALIVHGVWKRRKAKKGELARPEVQSGQEDAL